MKNFYKHPKSGSVNGLTVNPDRVLDKKTEDYSNRLEVLR
jgi:hypothetical protein